VILHSVNADEDASHPPPQHAPNKKERRILKHELFIERMWRLILDKCTNAPKQHKSFRFVSPFFFLPSSDLLICNPSYAIHAICARHIRLRAAVPCVRHATIHHYGDESIARYVAVMVVVVVGHRIGSVTRTIFEIACA
jgi:hypothetical protein